MKRRFRITAMLLAAVLAAESLPLCAPAAAWADEPTAAGETDSAEEPALSEGAAAEAAEPEDASSGDGQGGGGEADGTVKLDASKLPDGAEFDAETGHAANSWRFKDGILSSDYGIHTFSSKGDVTWTYKNGVYRFSNGLVIDDALGVGIDVSVHNGTIDWAKAKKAGVKFAIIRCGWGMDEAGQDDKQFFNNVRGCQENGIPFGVYLYSYADTTTRAKKEAQHTLRLLEDAGLSPSSLAYPVYYDLEDSSILSSGHYSKQNILNCAKMYCNAIKAQGYAVGIYANQNWWETYLTGSTYDQWDRWVAAYNNRGCRYGKTFSIWQCSNEGSVKGIGSATDLNVQYREFKDGALQTDSKGTRYRKNDGTYLKDAWKEVDGKRYYFGSDGYALTGVQQVGDYLYRFGADGSVKSNTWHTWEDGSRSFFSKNFHSGAAVKGTWWTVSGKRRYFGSDSRLAVNKVEQVGSYLYLLNGDGVAKTNTWYTWDDGRRSFFSGNFHQGAAVQGTWWTVSGKRRRFGEDGRLLVNDIVDVGGYYYWLDKDGAAKSNSWYTWEDGSRSFFSKNFKKGAAVKGRWWTVSGKRRYFDDASKCTV